MNPSNKNRNNLKIHVTTLGCSKNLYDSEILMGQLKANQVNLTKDPNQADVIIVNTCGFITPAKQESIQAILEAGKIKKSHSGQKLLVCGCLSKRYQPELRKDIPEVDEYFGTEDYQSILEYLNLNPDPPEYLYQKRLLSQARHYAYLKISEGCNHTCAFCAIPLIRGKHRSRPMDQILREAHLLAEKGVKELILIAQDTTYYGVDLYQHQRIVELLQELEKIEQLDWIRLHYAYPTTFPDELIDVIAQSSQIVHYLDLPVQHITDSMLKIMKRGGSSHQIREIFRKIRERIPDIILRTTLIVGHPGETEADFADLKQFVEEMRFDRLGVFTYSPEENTAAFSLPAPDPEIARERYSEIMELQQKISLEKNYAKLGKVYRVLIDEYDAIARTAIGRTYGDSPEIDNEVILENVRRKIKPGEFYNVRIIDVGEYEIFGQILEDE